MRKTRHFRAFSGLPWLGYRARVLLFAVLSASGPSLPAIAFLVGMPAWLVIASVLAGAIVCLSAWAAIWELLRPIGLASTALADPSRVERAAALPRNLDGEMGVLLAGIADIASKVVGLHHRWVQRHPLTALPTREFLLMQMADDIQQTDAELLLGVVRLADYDRLAAFDAPSAELTLKAFAERLCGLIGKDRPLAHVDRDCFAIWFRGSADTASAASELQAICYALGAEVSAGDLRLVPDVEAGVALYPRDASDPAALVSRAVASLAKPGQAGSTGADFVTSSARAKELFGLEQDLRHAIRREQLQLHFQPVVDLARRRLVGAEALLRWHHPQAGLIPPSRFVPILEDAGLTDEIGMWTLNAACREARNWQRQGLAGLKVAVNLSATQLHDPGLKQMIARTLERHRLHAKSLELELTETAATEDAERTFALFGELRAMGISLAIDDFGSGYSSLSYVKNLPFDKLKIDREFVVKVHERRDSQAICRSLIELSRGLGIKLLAEGVESEEEVRLLRSFGCTLFQGYYFARPLLPEEFVRRARNHDWPQLTAGRPDASRTRIRSRLPV